MDADTFSETLWESDVQFLIDETQRSLAREIFGYVTERLKSIPFQRYSSRKHKSDGETIFRTRLHRSFWMLLNTKSGILDIRFPDKQQQLSIHEYFNIKQSPGTQWSRKRERRVTIPRPFPRERIGSCFELLEQIHSINVAWYGRKKESSITLLTQSGSAGSKQFAPLERPDADTFQRLLASPQCNECGTSVRLNLAKSNVMWKILCDEHLPVPSPWTQISSKVVPHGVKELVWHRDSGRCVQCGSTNYLAFDHIIPANRGSETFAGGNCESNICLRCRTCNCSKSNKWIL